MMITFSTLEAVFLALAFLVPGVILHSARQIFLTGRSELTPLRYLTYGTMSFVIFSVPINFLISTDIDPFWKSIGWMSILLVGPMFLGLIWGIITRKDIVRRALTRIGLTPVHAMPTAWDWKWGCMEEGEWVLITLKDNTEYFGYYGSESFASSDPRERDVFIEKLFARNEDSQWELDAGGVLIIGTEIRTIEFWSTKPDTRGGQDE